MDQIADEVGLNKGTLYHYYPSKSALLNELLSEQIEATLNLLAQVPLTGSGADRMRSFVRAQIAHVATKHDELVVFFQEMHWIDDHLPREQAQSIRQGIYRYEEFVKSLLAEGARTREFRQLDPTVILYSIIGILAYIPMWYRTPAGGTDEHIIDQITDFVMSGILAPGVTAGDVRLEQSSNAIPARRSRARVEGDGPSPTQPDGSQLIPGPKERGRRKAANAAGVKPKRAVRDRAS